MKKVQIVFEDDLTDVDIVAVPDKVADDIETLGQQFCDWLSSEEASEYHHKTPNGMFYSILETEGFVSWLNRFYCKDTDEKVTIVEEHTEFDVNLPFVEF